MGWSQVRILPVSEDSVAQLAEHLRCQFRLLPDTEFWFRCGVGSGYFFG